MFEVGHVFTHAVSVGAIDDIDFAKASGDWNPLHHSHTFASRTIFKRPIVHGVLTLGYVSRLMWKVAPEGHYSVFESLSTDFQAPVRVGDRLLIEAEVTEWTPGPSRLRLRITVKRINMLDGGKPPKEVLVGEARIRVFALAEELAKAS